MHYADYLSSAPRRLAFELLLQLGQCDIASIGPQHVKDGMLVFSLKKPVLSSPAEFYRRLKPRLTMGKPIKA